MVLAGLLAVVLTVDGGTPNVYYRVPAGSLLDIRDGDGPFALPVSVLIPQPTFEVIDAELKAFHQLQRAPPQAAVTELPVQAYLIMAGIVAAAFTGVGVGIGFFISEQRHR